MKLLRILNIALFCAAIFSSSYAMDANTTQLQQNKQMHPVIELLSCLHFSEVPSDIHPLIVKRFLVADTAKEFRPIYQAGPKVLSGSLLRWCNKIPTLPNFLMPYEEFGALFASDCAKNNIDLKSFTDLDNKTILHHLVLAGKKEATLSTKSKAIQIIHIAAKSDANSLYLVKDSTGWTALHWAASEGKDAIVQQLLSSADINKQEIVTVKDDINQTALHWAACNMHKRTIQELITMRGINAQELATIKNLSNQTALDLAKEKNLHEIVTLLQPHTN